MIQKTKTPEGVLLEDDATGESVRLSWEDLGELVVLIEGELVAAAVPRAVNAVETMRAAIAASSRP